MTCFRTCAQVAKVRGLQGLSYLDKVCHMPAFLSPNALASALSCTSCLHFCRVVTCSPPHKHTCHSVNLRRMALNGACMSGAPGGGPREPQPEDGGAGRGHI